MKEEKKPDLDQLAMKAEYHSPYYPSKEELMNHAIFLLQGYGFNGDEIKKEYRIGNHRIDVVGIRDDLKVAIELGDCDHHTLIAEKEAYEFDQVIWLPYWYMKIAKIYSNEYLQLKSENIKLNNELTELRQRDNVWRKEIQPHIEAMIQMYKKLFEFFEKINLSYAEN